MKKNNLKTNTMTIEQIKTEMNSLMEKVSQLEKNNSNVALTQEQLTKIVKTVVEDTTREIRDSIRGNIDFIDDYVELSMDNREVYVDVNQRSIEDDIVSIIDENGLPNAMDDVLLEEYVTNLILRVSL